VNSFSAQVVMVMDGFHQCCAPLISVQKWISPNMLHILHLDLRYDWLVWLRVRNSCKEEECFIYSGELRYITCLQMEVMWVDQTFVVECSSSLPDLLIIFMVFVAEFVWWKPWSYLESHLNFLQRKSTHVGDKWDKSEERPKKMGCYHVVQKLVGGQLN